jgi:hypothetical protein
MSSIGNNKMELNQKLDDMKKAIDSYRNVMMSAGKSQDKMKEMINKKSNAF